MYFHWISSFLCSYLYSFTNRWGRKSCYRDWNNSFKDVFLLLLFTSVHHFISCQLMLLLSWQGFCPIFSLPLCLVRLIKQDPCFDIGWQASSNWHFAISIERFLVRVLLSYRIRSFLLVLIQDFFPQFVSTAGNWYCTAAIEK